MCEYESGFCRLFVCVFTIRDGCKGKYGFVFCMGSIVILSPFTLSRTLSWLYSFVIYDSLVVAADLFSLVAQRRFGMWYPKIKRSEMILKTILSYDKFSYIPTILNRVKISDFSTYSSDTFTAKPEKCKSTLYLNRILVRLR